MKIINLATALTMLLCTACASNTYFTVVTDPVGAGIFVDGNQMGTTPATIKLKFKENAQMVTEKKVLVVRLPGYKEKKEVISSQENGAKELRFKLEPEQVEQPVSAVVSEPTTTPAPAIQETTKSEAITGPTVTEEKAVQAPSVEKAVGAEPATPEAQDQQPVVKEGSQ